MKRLAVPLLLVALLAVMWLWSDARERAARERGVAEAPASAADRAQGRSGTEPAAAGAKPARAVEPGPGTVKGVVSARHGPLWGARVRAVHQRRTVAEAHTGPDGAYALTLDAPVQVDLWVEPDPETGLVPVRRDGIEVLPGATHEHDIALTSGSTVVVSVLRPTGAGLAHVDLLLFEREALGAREDVHPAELTARVVQAARSGSTGRATFTGLPPGSYRLLIGSPSWMLARPVCFWADAGEVAAYAVPALSVNVRVRDIETGRPIGRFEARLRFWKEAAPLTFPGRDGRLARRMRWPWRDPPAPGLLAWLEIRAEGYFPPGDRGTWTSSAPRNPQRYWLAPKRAPNTTIRVHFDDGAAFRGTASASIKAAESSATAQVDLQRGKPGLFRAALPRGSWQLRVALLSTFARRSFRWSVCVGDGEVIRECVLPAGGTLILQRPEGWKQPDYRSYAACIRRVGSKRGRQVWLGPEEERLDGVPPGTYQIGYAERVEEKPYRVPAVHWFRTVTIGAGDEVVVLMPSR